MDADLGQALFGYDRGHRLIAASIVLDRDSEWILRAVTDMKFGPHTRQCFTILPIATSGLHAFIRTWPAPRSFRPGSVWSHAILIPADVVAALADFGFLDRLFRRPPVQEPEEMAAHIASYRQPIAVDLPHRPTPVSAPVDLLDTLVAATYSDMPAEVRAQDLVAAEQALLGLVAQQWPALRSTFAARTRHRLSASSVAQFQVQVVERPSGKVTPTTPARTPWSLTLLEDLLSPDDDLRSFLSTYGPSPSMTRAMVPALVDIFSMLSSGTIEGVSALVQERYPKTSAMAELKLALYGPARSDAEALGAWPTAELERLRALLALRPSTVDYRELAVGKRLAELLLSSSSDASSVVAPIDWAALQGDRRSAIVDALTVAGDSKLLVSVVANHPNLAAELLDGRPDTWSASETWELLGTETVTHLVLAADPPVRGDVFRGLLTGGLAGPATTLCARDPQLWWALLDPEHVDAIASNATALSVAADVLRDVGPQRVGRFPYAITDTAQARVLVRTSKPDDRLWQQAPNSVWIGVAEQAVDAPVDADLLVVALAAAERSGSADVRRRTWSLVFGPLHELLDGAGPPEGTERTLRETVPGGPSWDWCARLRHGLARAAVDDGWSTDELASVASGAAEHAGDVLRRYVELSAPQGWSLVDALRRFLGS